jgi:hypothetical protein
MQHRLQHQQQRPEAEAVSVCLFISNAEKVCEAPLSWLQYATCMGGQGLLHVCSGQGSGFIKLGLVFTQCARCQPHKGSVLHAA